MVLKDHTFLKDHTEDRTKNQLAVYIFVSTSVKLGFRSSMLVRTCTC